MAHDYLGDSLEQVNVRHFFDAGDIISIPILELPGIIIFPNETLPLRIRNRNYFALFEDIKNGKTLHIGVVVKGKHKPNSTTVGTVCDVRSWSSMGNEISAVTKGQQRFSVLEFSFYGGICVGKVELLSDSAPIIPSNSYRHIQSATTFLNNSYESTAVNCIPLWVRHCKFIIYKLCISFFNFVCF